MQQLAAIHGIGQGRHAGSGGTQEVVERTNLLTVRMLKTEEFTLFMDVIRWATNLKSVELYEPLRPLQALSTFNLLRHRILLRSSLDVIEQLTTNLLHRHSFVKHTTCLSAARPEGSKIEFKCSFVQSEAHLTWTLRFNMVRRELYGTAIAPLFETHPMDEVCVPF